MIAPIRPPLIKQKRRSLRETPLERARRAVAESLLSDEERAQRPRRPRWFLWAGIATLLGAVLAVVALLANR